MPDVREQFHHLAGDLSGLRPPAASEVRRAAERRRVVSRLLTTATGLVITVGLVGALVQVANDRGAEQTLSADPSMMPPPSSSAKGDPATPSPRVRTPALAWLPEPWALVASDTYSDAKGEPSTYRFCGDTMIFSGSVDVAEQLLRHPSGRTAHLLAFTPEGEDPMQLFKFSYASCLEEGAARSVGGPRNVWSFGLIAGASEVVRDSLHLVSLEGASPDTAPTRRDAEAALDAWGTR